MRARPYKLFGAHERAALVELVEQRFARWAREWLPAQPAPRLECFAALPAASGEWIAAGSGGEWWAIGAAAGEIDALAAALCGRDARAGRSALAAQAARAAAAELAAALAGANAAPLEGATPPPPARGSAGVSALAVVGDARLRLASSAEWTLRALKERLPAPPPARLTGWRQAIAPLPVGLRVVAGWAELELGELRGLEVGDVITLDARLERPMRVELGASGAPVCSARLGLREGRRAASLTAAR